MSLPLTVIVVSYNTRDLLRRCLSSLHEVDEVIVVDNASRDGSAEVVESEFPHFVLIRSSTNVGFGKANNLGLRLAKNPIRLLLNSDAAAEPGALASLLACFDDLNVIAAGGALVNDAGHIQPSCCSELTLWRLFCEQLLLEKLFAKSRLFNGYWLNRWLASDRPSQVGQVMGACLMVRGEAEFDEEFFLYCEDTELCWRLAKRGQIWYEPRARFLHALGASSEGRRDWSVAMYNRGKELYFLKSRGLFWAVIAWLINRLGALLRTVSWLLATIATLGMWSSARQRLGWFCRVLFAPIQGPALPADASHPSG
ncbi:MAG: glycosyltransferase family 2 protein [Chthonomonas sp.]|nr:glycosyltransferase family 2 protein [Chthonomonas sp.]